jgi:hypothetical protein
MPTNKIPVSETHQLAFGDMTNTFTGSDITAIIIRRDDQLLLKRAKDYLDALETAQNPQTSLHFQGGQLVGVEQVPGEFASPPGQDVPYDKGTLFPVINLQAITVSTFRAKRQVRALGHVSPRGIARGSRTIGGTIILTEFDRDAFWGLIAVPDPVAGADINVGDAGIPVLPDQLAAFDILLMFANEAGTMAYRMIYEVELVTNGVVYSIQDMYNENTLSFLCTDVTPLIPMPSLITRGGALMSETLIPGEGKTIRISPMANVESGKEVLRRYRLLKQSRTTNR